MIRSTNEKGQLMIGGVSASELAKKYGTPLYVMDELKIRKSMQSYTEVLRECYGGRGLILYASKAFSCKEIYRIASGEGLGADIVSGGELYTAKAAGFDMSKVCLHGNNKSREELVFALKCGVGRIVVDNHEELVLLNALADELRVSDRKQRAKPNIMIRVKPGISAHTHEFIKTGQIDSKFGFAMETGEAMAAVRTALGMENLNLVGVHCHIGSQILIAEPFVIAARVMMGFLADIKEQTGTELPELNLGGGFGVVYNDEDSHLDVEDCLRQIFCAVRETAKSRNINEPFLYFEPGRSIVAESGTTLYTVGSLKTIPDIRTYLSVDGGMCDNMRYILYKARYDMALADKMNLPNTTTVTVAGKCCESGDLIGENVQLGHVEAGDILAVFCTGAYNFSMYSTYNRNLRPPVVMAGGEKSRLIVRRQSFSDIVRNDL